MSQSVAYTISYNISEALRGLKQLQKALSQVGQVTSQTQEAVQASSQMSKIDLQAWAGAFQQLGGMAKGMFDSIVSASPSMSVAFAQMSFAVDMMWLSIGENLAPVINDTLVPAIEGLTSWITQLSPEMQQWIGLTIGLTVAASALAVGIIAIQTAGAPLIAIILGITVAIAGLIVLWQNDFLGMKTVTIEMFESIRGSLGETMGNLGDLGTAFVALFELVKPALEVFVQIFVARIQMMVENFIAYINLIVTVFTEIINIIVAIAQGDWAQVWESMGNIVQAFVDYFKTVFENFIGFINTIVEALFGMDLNELGGVILEAVKNAMNVHGLPATMFVGLLHVIEAHFMDIFDMFYMVLHRLAEVAGSVVDQPDDTADRRYR